MSAIRKAWRIEGMHCPHCETAVRRALSGVSGLSEVNVSFPNGTLTALWDEKLLQEKEIDARLREAGYGLICGTMRAGWLRDVLRLLLALAAAGIFYLLLTRTAVADLMRAFFGQPVAGRAVYVLLLLGHDPADAGRGIGQRQAEQALCQTDALRLSRAGARNGRECAGKRVGAGGRGNSGCKTNG